MRAKITKRLVDGLAPGEKELFIWDTDLEGFGLRVSPTGVMTYFVQYRMGGRGSQQRRVKIARHGRLPPDQARIEAGKILRKVAEGVDPSVERRGDQRRTPTVAELADRYIEQHVNLRNKASTAAEFGRLVEKLIKPRLGRLAVNAVSRTDIATFHHDMRGTPRSANQALAVLSKMFGLAEVWGLRPDGSNPCRRIEKYKERKRERFMTEAEIAELGKVLAEAEGQELTSVLNAIRLLLLTGLRLGEAVALRWTDVDLQSGPLSIRDAKAGARTHMIGAAAAAFMAQMPKIGEWVLPSTDPKKPLPKSTLEHAWGRIRETTTVALWCTQSDSGISTMIAELEQQLQRAPTIEECRAAALKAEIQLPAGITDVRLHDLRHTVGTYAGQAGANAFIVRDLLGHKTLAIAGRYTGRTAPQSGADPGKPRDRRRCALDARGPETSAVPSLAAELLSCLGVLQRPPRHRRASPRLFARPSAGSQATTGNRRNRARGRQ